jgi:regulator of nonsense transcripts 1
LYSWFFSSERFSPKCLPSRPSNSNTYASPHPLLENPEKPFVFQEVRGEEYQRHGGSFANLAEARAVVDRISQLRALAAGQDPNWFRNDKVRIITFYQAQVDLINSLLKPLGFGHRKSGLVASTVDSSQGCEANLVIVSFVRTCRKRRICSTDGSARSMAGFLTDNRRINVALTRAKFELICIGSVSHLLENDQLATLHALARWAQEQGCIVRAPRNGSSTGAAIAERNTARVGFRGGHPNQKRKEGGKGSSSSNNNRPGNGAANEHHDRGGPNGGNFNGTSHSHNQKNGRQKRKPWQQHQNDNNSNSKRNGKRQKTSRGASGSS